jgi:1,4-dihydroxy-2-naphthoate octaprenyltransferase
VATLDARSLSRGGAGAWLLAARPATLTASLTPVLVGTAVAASQGEARLLPALTALVAALLIQVGTNFANDAFDFEQGADTAERYGPLRAAQAGLLSPAALRAATLVVFAAAALIGLYLIARGGWPIAALGLLGLLAGYAYTGGPLRLGYHGLGDPLVFLFFGVFAVWGTHRVQTLGPAGLALAASIPIGLLATALIAVNNLRDIDTDRRADKRTLAVRLGSIGARRYYALLLAGSYLALPGLWWMGAPSASFWLPLLTAPMAWRLWRKVRVGEGAALNLVLAGTARLELVFGALMAGGLLL